MSDEQQEADDIASAIQHYSEVFDQLCQDRHEAGAKEYGVITFLGNDVVRMMLEELADTANYCRMQSIKLLMLQSMLEGELQPQADAKGNISVDIGVSSFTGTGEGWRR